MTNNQHGQVPEALIDLIDAYAETRHRCGGIYNARTEAARKAVIEALSGVQALSAAPAIGDELRDTLVAASAAIAEQDDRAAQKMIREILAASPTPPAEQQAPKETLGGVNGWRDISTAPKDGSRFVTIGYNYGLYSEGRHICVAQWFRGCWMETSDWNEASELKHLTHWLPLPSPPDNAAELNDLDVSVSPQQAAPEAAPGEREQAAQRLRELAGVPQNDVTDPFHPRYIEGYKAGHAAGRKRAAPQQEAQEPVAWQSRIRPTWGANTSPWSHWEPCTKGQAEDYWKTPLLHDWAYEARALYTAPQPAPAPLSESIDQVERALAIIGVVGAIDGHDVVRRESVLEIARRAALAAQGGKDA